VFEQARADSTIVLLDGQGMDEQWAGYDYYRHALNGGNAGLVQGSQDSPVRSQCLVPEFARLAEAVEFTQPFPDRLRNLQYRDACYTKIPRALRFNDRISMRSSTELREPFLDHRLFEFALRQPVERKILNGQHKWFLRQLGGRLLPSGVVEAPKRPVQTPQREWLRGPLKSWATECVESALNSWAADWLHADRTRRALSDFLDGEGDNSFFVWQWISIGVMAETFQSMKVSA
jgi:asparagine synthase (glutamine-hydrolysing)